ncbi:RLA class I histocompatibility antigen, alpha chain 11/11-like [Elgaria multicarinata webbii]|uniref:RLA class I histocompatibility antigen, alpha chain 11/11-like n=1 Tax=Elgaria multicarinata webbii TaxID=159646 RepID=UPI002FCD523C
MRAFRWSLLLLMVAALLLGGCPGSSSHSLRYYYTSVSEPSQGLPRFVAVGYVDDQLFVHYDSHGSTRRAESRARWMAQMVKEDAHYLDRNTQSFRYAELWSRDNLAGLRNPGGGLHIWQLMYGCEVFQDGHKGGFWQYGYDGRDFLSLDNETLAWTAASEEAQNTQRRWEAETRNAPVYKAYLEGRCVEWLWKHLAYGKETLLRKEPPVGKVTRKPASHGKETLVCQAHGFYPKEIDATWTRDGDIMDHVTFRRSVAPNSDGTYHLRISIEIDPMERDRYRCHVDHAALREPLVLACGEPAATVGAILEAVAVVLVAAGIIFLLSKKTLEAFETWREKRGYKAVSRKELLPVSNVRLLI